MIALTPVLEVAAVDRNSFNDWMGISRPSAKVLRTKFRKTSPGVARELSRENALEVGFVGALVRAGLRPADAAKLVIAWIEEERTGTLLPLFALNPVTGEGLAFSNSNIGFLDLRLALDEAVEGDAGYAGEGKRTTRVAMQVNIIDRSQIVADVDTLFNGEASA
jgi:hypothetical protein